MEYFVKEYFDGFIVINVNLTRATLREAQELKQILEEEITIQKTKLVLDISQCEFIDSSFLGAIVLAHKRALAHAGKLNIVEPSPKIHDFFHLNRILDHLNTYKTRREAIEGLNLYIPSSVSLN